MNEERVVDVSNEQAILNQIIGSTIVEITGCVIGSSISEEYGHGHRGGVFMRMNDGRILRLYHMHECCESVCVEDITGDLSDLIGSPIQMAEVVSSVAVDDMQDVSEQWTFYKFGTLKGYVTIRFMGESNGYYSTDVNIEFVKTR